MVENINVSNKKKTQKDKKSFVVDFHKALHPEIVWDLTRNGTYKPYCFDIADSLTISKAAVILIEEKRNEK